MMPKALPILPMSKTMEAEVLGMGDQQLDTMRGRRTLLEMQLREMAVHWLATMSKAQATMILRPQIVQSGLTLGKTNPSELLAGIQQRHGICPAARGQDNGKSIYAKKLFLFYNITVTMARMERPKLVMRKVARALAKRQ